jgi:hypothetical protein
MRGISWLNANRLASQEWLCSVDGILGRVTSLPLVSPVVWFAPFSLWTDMFCSISSAGDGKVRPLWLSPRAWLIRSGCITGRWGSGLGRRGCKMHFTTPSWIIDENGRRRLGRPLNRLSETPKHVYQSLLLLLLSPLSLPYLTGALGGAVGWGTALQAGRSRVRFPMASSEFFIDNPAGRTMALGLTQPLTEISTTFTFRLSWNLETSTSWNPQGLSRPVMWLLCLLFYLMTSYLSSPNHIRSFLLQPAEALLIS